VIAITDFKGGVGNSTMQSLDTGPIPRSTFGWTIADIPNEPRYRRATNEFRALLTEVSVRFSSVHPEAERFLVTATQTTIPRINPSKQSLVTVYSSEWATKP
jgi:hypothetical protein